MSLYRIVEVPDPSGQLTDMIEELLDNSALVEADPDYAAAQIAWSDIPLNQRYDFMENVEAVVNAALGIDPPEEI